MDPGILNPIPDGCNPGAQLGLAPQSRCSGLSRPEPRERLGARRPRLTLFRCAQPGQRMSGRLLRKPGGGLTGGHGADGTLLSVLLRFETRYRFLLHFEGMGLLGFESL